MSHMSKLIDRTICVPLRSGWSHRHRMMRCRRALPWFRTSRRTVTLGRLGGPRARKPAEELAAAALSWGTAAAAAAAPPEGGYSTCAPMKMKFGGAGSTAPAPGLALTAAEVAAAAEPVAAVLVGAAAAGGSASGSDPAPPSPESVFGAPATGSDAMSLSETRCATHVRCRCTPAAPVHA